MNNLTLNQVASITSLEITTLTGKLHKNVIRDIRVMFVELELTEHKFELSYKDASGKSKDV